MEDAISHFVQCGPDPHESDGTAKPSAGTSKTPRPEARSKGWRIKSFIKKIPTSPLTHVFSTKYWTEGPFQFESKNAPLIQSILHNLGLNYCDQSIEELFTIFNNTEPNKLIFNSPLGDIREYYYSLDKSIYVMEELLKFQFDDNATVIKICLNDLYNICNKVI